MFLDPSALLDGPRGRRLCLEILLDGARRADTPEMRDAVHAAFRAAHGLETGSSTLIVIGNGEPFDEPDVSPADVATAFTDLGAPEISPEVLDAALEASVDGARYWQAPDGADVLASSAEMRPVLAPVAAAVARAPGAREWARPLDRERQWTVSFAGVPVLDEAPGDVLARWREEAAASEIEWAALGEGRWSGTWWSTPPAGLALTTPPAAHGDPLRLRYVEDGLGWQSARARRAIVPDGVVIEIAGPDDWEALCARHPLVVTASRGHDWGRMTDRRGPWVQPDWASMANEAVGVHLSVAGYLSTAGRVIPVGALGSSLVAGWSPGETYWFVEVDTGGDEERWARDGNTGPWHPA
ncbi:hypothetical protein [Microbacterium sp. T32]|uniref:hypothetical protein n=1 Tax=Microbacterium sp. T32 TaxID=1776083 RepID=UPI0007AC20D1|nr:hypothetical protein [Microbacterium sp. T32]KZE40689.1 hypothetical protein AVW09_13935 [Microbacterium sp. T32]